MSDYVFGCPKCNREFRVLPEFAGEVIQCPHCAQKMRIPGDYFVSDVHAEISPSSKTQTTAPADSKRNSATGNQITSPASESGAADGAKRIDSSSEVESGAIKSVSDSTVNSTVDEMGADAGAQAESGSRVAQMLPPQFAVLDPARFTRQSSADSQVFLPTAEGGVQSVSERLITIEYKGQKYTLVAMSPQQKQRRQIIVNIVSIFVAIGAIAGTIWILLK